MNVKNISHFIDNNCPDGSCNIHRVQFPVWALNKENN